MSAMLQPALPLRRFGTRLIAVLPAAMDAPLPKFPGVILRRDAKGFIHITLKPERKP